MAELVDGNKPVDFITLSQAIKDRAQLDEIGGPEYLSDLFSFVPSAANADYTSISSARSTSCVR